MRTLAHYCLAAGFAVLAGCASMGLPWLPSPPKPCHAGTGGTVCVVNVTVTGCNKDDISADPDRALVPPGLSGDVEWRLVGRSQWKFTGNGIVFKDPANGQFVNARPGNTVFKWNNRRTDRNEHKYNIEVTDGNQTCRKDPSIMN